MRVARKGMSAVTAVRVLALVSVALALMCAGLAFAWRAEHEAAECWRTMAQYKLETEGLCEG
jgi:type II secretory pathway component PulK